MRDWNIIAEKYSRSVAHYSDNTSNFSLARAYTASLSLMASYWFLPCVREIFRIAMSILDGSVVKRIPAEFQAKLAIRFQASSIEDLDVSRILSKSGKNVSQEEIDASTLEQDVLDRFNVPTVKNTSGLIESIRARLLLVDRDREKEKPPISIWSKVAPEGDVVWYSPDITVVENERITRTSTRPILSALLRSIQISTCGTHIVELDHDLQRYNEVFNFITRSNTSWATIRRTVVMYESRVLMTRDKGGEIIINVPPGLLLSQLQKAPWVPVWYKSHRGQPPVDVLPSRRYALDSAQGSYVLRTNGQVSAYWPMEGQVTSFGGAEWISTDDDRGFWSTGQSVRSVSASWFSERAKGNVKLYLSDSILETRESEAALSVKSGLTYPMVPVVEHMTGGNFVRSHKYWCADQNKDTPLSYVVRYSTNGPGSCPNDSPRANLVTMMRRCKLNAGIYRPDKYKRLDGKTPLGLWSLWLPFYSPGISHREYTSQKCLFLCDGFGSPYELFPAIVKGRRVVLFSDLTQYCESFMEHTVHYYKCRLVGVTKPEVEKAIEWMRGSVDKNLVKTFIEQVRESVSSGRLVRV